MYSCPLGLSVFSSVEGETDKYAQTSSKASASCPVLSSTAPLHLPSRSLSPLWPWTPRIPACSCVARTLSLASPSDCSPVCSRPVCHRQWQQFFLFCICIVPSSAWGFLSALHSGIPPVPEVVPKEPYWMSGMETCLASGKANQCPTRYSIALALDSSF